MDVIVDESKKKSAENEDSSAESSGPDEYELDGFVVNEIDEDERAKEEARKKKKRSRPRKQMTLDDDDLSLIEENTGSKVRHKPLRRLKKKARIEDEPNEAQAQERALFGNEVDDVLATHDPVEPEPSDSDDFVSDDDDIHSWLVEVDENGQTIKRKKHQRDSFRDSSLLSATADQMLEAQDVFGDVDALNFNEDDLDDRLAPKTLEEQLTRFKQHLEPSLLAERFFTIEDEKVRQIDIPERLQLRYQGLELPIGADTSFNREAEWIYNEGFKLPSDASDKSDRNIVIRIISVLEFLRKDNLEIPFIRQYRKEYYLPELKESALIHPQRKESLDDRDDFSRTWPKAEIAKVEHSPLWKIYDLDEKYAHLLARKSNLLQKYQQITSLDRELLNLLEQSQNEQEVKDLYDHFMLYYGEELQHQATSQHKRPVKRDFYSSCKKSGIVELAHKWFGLSAKEFGNNLMDDLPTFEPKQPDLDPLTAAKDFLKENRGYAGDPEAVLKACRVVLAQEIGCDPLVRQSLRLPFHSHATVSTFPTARGKKEIDKTHAYAGIKRLNEKPVDHFKDDQYLLIAKAEKEGFITVQVCIPSQDPAQPYKGMERLYLSDAFSLIAKQWNEQRRETLKIAIETHLHPLFQSEIRTKLWSEACEFVIASSADNLYRRLMQSPLYQSPSSSSSDHDRRRSSSKKRKSKGSKLLSKDVVKIVGCCWDAGNATTYCVSIDEEGEPIDRLKLTTVNDRPKQNNTSSSSSSSSASSSSSSEFPEFSKLRDFIRSSGAQAVVLGSTPGQPDSRRFYEQLKRASPSHVTVSYFDSEVGRIFMNSERSKKEFPDDAPNARVAISLARLVQDPLTEYASLTENPDEILCLNLHAQQTLVPIDQLLARLTRTFIDVTNWVGVDINKIMLHKHATGPFKFVCGLGPRKALGLLQSLYRRGGMLSSRDELEKLLTPVAHEGDDEDKMEEDQDDDDDVSGRKKRRASKSTNNKKNGTTSKIYMNCAGFVRVRAKYFKDSEDRYIDVLDDTRVHPANYIFARQMAADDLESNEAESQWQYLVKELMEDPRPNHEKLELNLDAFAQEWERSGRGKANLILNDIKMELLYPFIDPRISFTPPSSEQIFYLLSGESEKTFKSGAFVTARVSGLGLGSIRCVWCRLANGLVAKIDEKDLELDGVPLRCEDVKVDQTLTCRIRKIDVNSFQIDLVCSSASTSSMSDYEFRQNADEYLLEDEPSSSTRRSSSSSSSSRPRKQKRGHRVVSHPNFQDITFKDAERNLATKEPGEQGVIIRPSSKGMDHLTITWKFYDDIFIHSDVLEKNKSHALSGGQVLVVKDKEFEDLDEIIYRYIVPITDLAKSITKFSFFKGGDKKSIDNRLKADKDVNPGRIPYYLGGTKEYPGKFVLYYMPGRHPKHEYVSVEPEGLRFRGKLFKSPDQLIHWFKRHYNDNVDANGNSATSSSSASGSSRSNASRSSRNNHRDDNAQSNYGGSWD